MANNLIQIKRTSVSGRAANTTTLTNAGELALNMTDGIMYSTNGSVVFEIGANTTNSKVTGNLTVKGIIANSTLGTDGQVLTTNGTSVYWSTVSGGGGSVAANSMTFTGNGSNTIYTLLEVIADQDAAVVTLDGLVQVPNTHYTISSTTLTFTTAPISNSVIEVRTMPAGSTTAYVNNYMDANSSAQYTWTNTHTFSNTITLKAISANGSLGTSTQVLSSNGTAVYWANSSGTGKAIAMAMIFGG